MRPDNLAALTELSKANITIRYHADVFARKVCEIMDSEGITDRDTAMFYLLDKAQMKMRVAVRDWDDSESSREDIRRAREYVSIAVRLARSGQ